MYSPLFCIVPPPTVEALVDGHVAILSSCLLLLLLRLLSANDQIPCLTVSEFNCKLSRTETCNRLIRLACTPIEPPGGYRRGYRHAGRRWGGNLGGWTPNRTTHVALLHVMHHPNTCKVRLILDVTRQRSRWHFDKLGRAPVGPSHWGDHVLVCWLKLCARRAHPPHAIFPAGFNSR